MPAMSRPKVIGANANEIVSTTNLDGLIIGIMASMSVRSMPAIGRVMKSRRSLDHLVGAGEQRRRNVEAKRLSGLQIDHKLDLRLDGKRSSDRPSSHRCAAASVQAGGRSKMNKP